MSGRNNKIIRVYMSRIGYSEAFYALSWSSTDSHVQSLMFIHIFLGAPHILIPSTGPGNNSLEMLLCLETWPYENNFFFFILCRTCCRHSLWLAKHIYIGGNIRNRKSWEKRTKKHKFTSKRQSHQPTLKCTQLISIMQCPQNNTKDATWKCWSIRLHTTDT